MIKKIAKKSLLILLLFIITIYGVLTPFKNVQLDPNTCSALWWTTPQKIAKDDREIKMDDPEKDWCPDCSAPVKAMSIWNMLRAPIDTVLSLIPRLLVFIIKWIVILFANILQNAMKPRSGSFLDGINRFTGEGNIARWLWQNSLYFANIMITLFLIWIAISIILEKKEYINYHSLTKLLVVALLINFSLVICTLLVDISNYAAALFMSGVDGQAFSCAYACIIHKVANSFNCFSTRMVLSQTIQNSLALAVGMIFVGQLLGLIIFVFTRMIYLWFLVGVSPLAIVMSSIPETEGIYKKWLGLFQTNLIKLPAIAAASYFILNAILFISNKSMLAQVETGDIMEHVLVTTFIIIILSQGLLMAAQAIGVEQVAKMSSMVNSAVKKGWDAVRKPVTSAGMKKFTSWKPVQSFLKKAKNNRVPIVGGTIARMASQTQGRVNQEQAKTQKEIDDYKDNGNYGQLEIALRNASKTGDKAKFLQAYEALSDLKKQGKWTDRSNLLGKHQGQVKDLMEQDVFKRSEVGKKLRDSDLYLDSGPGSSNPKYMTEAANSFTSRGITPSKRQLLERAQELAVIRPYQDIAAPGAKELLNDMSVRVSDRATFKQTDWKREFDRLYYGMTQNTNDFDHANAGDNFVQMFKKFQQIFNATNLKAIFNSVPLGQQRAFWTKIAVLAIRADKIQKNLSGVAGPGHVDYIDPTIAHNKNINRIPVSSSEIFDSEQRFINLANGGVGNSWMANNGIKPILKRNGFLR